MVEPSRAVGRRALAAGAAAAIALAGAGFVLGRNTSPRVEVAAAAPPPSPAPAVSPAPAPPVPVVTPPLGRADLLEAARAAADAFASGRPVPPEVAALDGRRFQLELPFGCRGPADADPLLGWRYDPEEQVLRVSVEAARFDPASWLGTAAAQVDLAEGFWVERPWSSSEACPPARSEGAAEPSSGGTAAAVAPVERTLALVQFHEAGGSRVGRRDGDAFRAVEKVAPDALDLSQGLRLRLSGRVVASPGNGAPVLCRSPAPAGGRPVCLLAVSLDEVSIANPAIGSTLATWTVSSAAAEGG